VPNLILTKNKGKFSAMNPIKPTDIPTLVQQLSDGCETSFSLLFDFFAPKILNTAKKMGLAHEDAEELQQEIFLVVWKNRNQLKADLSFNAYLLTILKSMIIKKAQQRARKVAFEKYALKTFRDESHETENELEYAELEKLSFSLIDKLPNAQKEVFLMKTSENLRAGEIANRLGISKRTVESHIYSATKRLKEKLFNDHILTIKSIAVLIFFQIL
jgi:RNA polymerase sigma-70 factor (ECF subfamily)